MFDFIELLFDTVWELFSIKWPGFNFSIGIVFIGVALACLGLKLLSIILGFSFSVKLPGKGDESSTGGNSTAIAIREERSLDTR